MHVLLRVPPTGIALVRLAAPFLIVVDVIVVVVIH